MARNSAIMMVAQRTQSLEDTLTESLAGFRRAEPQPAHVPAELQERARVLEAMQQLSDKSGLMPKLATQNWDVMGYSRFSRSPYPNVPSPG